MQYHLLQLCQGKEGGGEKFTSSVAVGEVTNVGSMKGGPSVAQKCRGEGASSSEEERGEDGLNLHG